MMTWWAINDDQLESFYHFFHSKAFDTFIKIFSINKSGQKLGSLVLVSVPVQWVASCVMLAPVKINTMCSTVSHETYNISQAPP